MKLYERIARDVHTLHRLSMLGLAELEQTESWLFLQVAMAVAKSTPATHTYVYLEKMRRKGLVLELSIVSKVEQVRPVCHNVCLGPDDYRQVLVSRELYLGASRLYPSEDISLIKSIMHSVLYRELDGEVI